MVCGIDNDEWEGKAEDEVNETLGVCVKRADGEAVGDLEGNTVGDLEGNTVGDAVGFNVKGRIVGEADIGVKKVTLS